MTFSGIKNDFVLEELKNSPDLLAGDKKKTEDFLNSLDLDGQDYKQKIENILNDEKLLYSLEESIIMPIFSYYKYLCFLAENDEKIKEEEKNSEKQNLIIKRILERGENEDISEDLSLLDGEHFKKLLKYYYTEIGFLDNGHSVNDLEYGKIAFFSYLNINISKYIFNKYRNEEDIYKIYTINARGVNKKLSDIINDLIGDDLEKFQKYEKYLMKIKRKSFLESLKNGKSKSVNPSSYYEYLRNFIRYNEDGKGEKLSFEEIISNHTPNEFFSNLS